MKGFWGSFASLLGVVAFIQTLLYTIFPPELSLLRLPLINLVSRVLHSFSSSSHYSYFDITEIIDGVNTNELYNAVQLYLSTTTSIISNNTTRLTLTRPINSSSITFGLSSTNNFHTITDTFRNVPVKWEHVVTQRQTHSFSWQPMPDEKRGFTLRIRDKDKPIILTAYLDHIMETANEIRRKNQDRLLYTNSRGGGSLDARGHHPWEAVPFKHPSTFDTLAMDPEKKLDIMQDLKDFADGQSFYQKTGRAWKRGYLLYGPPGTGKSSMIAAMANYLGYDIYDLELSEVHSNSELRKLLMKTTSRSIIVIEDIDCSINLSSRKKSNSSCSSVSVGGVFGSHHQCDMEGSSSAWGEEGGKNSITLSGLLNFTDGLWSCFGSERIFVFTTNHIDKIDPALLRSGRMDMHILMSYCSFPAMKILLKNYLDHNEKDLEEGIWRELEEVVDKAEMTPADISEVLIKNKRNKDVAVKELLLALERSASRRSPSSSSSNGMSRCKYGARDEDGREEEEQEKRALENPVPRDRDDEFDENCMKGEDDDDKKQEPGAA